MSTKEALLHELEKAPKPVLEELLDFVQFLRAKRPGKLVPRPRHPTRRKLSWDKTFAEMAAAKEDWSEWDATLGDAHET